MWLAQNKPDWSESHFQRVSSYLARDAYPIIGSRVVSEIEAPEIIPIIMACANIDTIKKISKALEPYFNDENLFVISTDLSHFLKYEHHNNSDF